jgi:hypothetical protein
LEKIVSRKNRHNRNNGGAYNGSENKDSDADINTGKTDIFTLTSGIDNYNIDAGYSSIADLNLVKE